MQMSEKFRARAAPAFQDDAFVPHIGKSFFALSGREKRSIQESLRSCFREDALVTQMLVTPFEYRKQLQGRTYQDWIEMLELLRTYEARATPGRTDAVAEGRAARPSDAEAFPASFHGVWMGERLVAGTREQMTISFTKDGALMRVEGGTPSGTVALHYSEKNERTGRTIYRFDPIRGDVRFLGERVMPSLMTGKVELRLVTERDEPYLNAHFSMGSGTVSTTSLGRGRDPWERTMRVVRDGDANTLFVYSDWASRAASQADGVHLTEARTKLRQTVDALRSDGNWRCLAQQNITVMEGTPAEFTSEEVTPRLYLIYSPTGFPGLTYRLGSSRPAYATVDGTENYPTVASSGTRSQFRFWLKPRPDLRASIPRAELTVYIFGRSLGDYGDGCEFEAIQANQYLWTLGKLLFVAMAESSRRESAKSGDAFGQLLSTLGRDGMIRSALQDLFPNAKENELGYMTRFAGVVLSRGASAGAIARGTLRESLVQQFEKEGVIPGYAARFADLLIDIEYRRSPEVSNGLR